MAAMQENVPYDMYKQQTYFMLNWAWNFTWS